MRQSGAEKLETIRLEVHKKTMSFNGGSANRADRRNHNARKRVSQSSRGLRSRNLEEVLNLNSAHK